MKNKGFTLIELLAVIVILAIIALIATPIIINIINDSREQSSTRSTELYLSGVQQAIARKNLTEEFNPSSCDVQSDGNLLCDGETLVVDVNGTKPTSGTIVFSNGKITDVIDLKINNKYYNYDSNKKLVSEPAVDLSTLEPGLYDSNYKLVASWDELVNDYSLFGTEEVCDYWEDEETGEEIEDCWDEDVITSDLFNNTNLKSGTILVISDELEEIPMDALRDTPLTRVYIPSSVTSIGWSAFEGCTGLTSINIPNSVTSIGMNAFYGSGLTSITISSSVTSIGSQAFYNCSGLTSIKVDSNNEVYADRGSNAIIKKSNNQLIVGCKNTIIPNSVTSIGDGAFFGSGITSITIPSSVTSIGSQAFYNCSGLTSITVDPNNTVYEDGGGNAIIKKSNNELVVGCKTTIIPNSVTSIGYGAFYGSGITSITIPSSVTRIGQIAFWRCTDLTTITIGNGVTSIGIQAFYGCTSLTSITIPNGVRTIEIDAFEKSGLTSATFESPAGWAVYNNSAGTSGQTAISESNLQNPSTAATYLKDTYKAKYWKRS